MAEAGAQDVVNEAQSVGSPSPIDVSGNTFTSNANGERKEQTSAAVDGHGHSYADATSSSSFSNSSTVQVNDFGSASTHDESSLGPPHSNGQLHPRTASPSATDANLVNGIDSASFAGSEDAGYQTLVANDESFHSDTDPLKAEGTEQSIDPTHRLERSNSVKKPTPFKAVSVTKNFLAKSGATNPTNGKLSVDKVTLGNQSSATAQQAPKPRLVAKTGRDGRSLNSPGSVGPSSGPDASTVWNRNRPVPPPPPKQFTDEELKQQYGIHMATRLQADEAGKESKWADIDDDEDDWAPETVQWMDGTKSTLLPSDIQPPPNQTAGSPQPVKETAETEDAPVQPVQAPSSTSSLGKTILRPLARGAAQPKPGLVLKNVPEKPVQQEKPKPTASSKSPWAPLPPVDKATPITFYPPATSPQPASSFHHESAIQDDDARVQSPAREIAADDFDRSWKESGERSGRELFNSQSGRYEPVKTVQRRSSRQDQGFRQPAVLQRPSQTSPAEPSAAFQSRDNRSWSQRRDTSSLGVSNAPYERRPSIDHEARAVRKPSISQYSPPKLEAVLRSDVLQPNEQNVAQVPGSQQTYSAQAAEYDRGAEDDLTIVRQRQQEEMRERIERNRKRKQEEEAREEAERKERIRLKMESLGPMSPNAKQSKLAEANSSDPPPNAAKPDGERPPAGGVISADEDEKAGTRTEALTQPETLKAPTGLDVAANSRSPALSSQPPMDKAPNASISDANQPVHESEVQQLPGLGHPMPTERQTRSWGRIPQNLDASSNWVNKPLAQGSANVWGPPTSDRPLGNGAFENEMNRMPSVQMPPNHQMVPASLHPSMSPFEAAHPTPSPPHAHARPDGLAHTSTPLIGGAPQRAPFQQAPGRPSNDYGFQRRPQQPPKDLAAAKNAWQSFGAGAAAHDTAMRDKLEREWAAKMAESGPQDRAPVIRETYTKTITEGWDRRPVSVAQQIHERHVEPSSEMRSVSQSMPAQQVINGRASRFFGPTADLLASVPSVQTLDELLESPRTSSPPPPETTEHPVHGARRGNPLVNIPKVMKVKLPPAPSAPGQVQEPVEMPPSGKFRTSGHQAIVNQVAWQDRFNGLFGRTAKTAPTAPTPPTTITQHAGQSAGSSATIISSSTKMAFDEHQGSASAATVSLPQAPEQQKLSVDPSESEFQTKPTEEELVDEREFGSSPTVQLFNGMHPRTEVVVSNCPAFHRGVVGNGQIAYYEKANKDFPASASALSFEYIDEEDLYNPDGTRIRIHLSGKPETTKILPRKFGAHSQTRRAKPRGQPKKPHLSTRSGRLTNGPPSVPLQAHPGGGSRQPSGGKPHLRSEGQGREKTATDGRRSDGKPVVSSSPGKGEGSSRPTEGSSGNSSGTPPGEKTRSGSQWAKTAKIPRRQRFNPIRA